MIDFQNASYVKLGQIDPKDVVTSFLISVAVMSSSRTCGGSRRG